MSDVNPPRYDYGDYHLRGETILYDVKDGMALLATGLFWVFAPVRCPDTDKRAYLLEIQPVNLERSMLMVRPEDMNVKYLKKALGERGIILHQESRVVQYLSMTAAYGGYVNAEAKTLIDKPGWFADGRGFYTGSTSIVACDVDEDRFCFLPVGRAPVAVKGDLREWQENVGTHAVANPVLLTTMCIFIASPFLQKMGLGTRLVNIFGSKGTGKTLCSQVGATVWGNGVDPAAGLYSEDPAYVTKFATTLNGIEPVLARYSPLPIALDEMTEQTTQMVGELLYKMASGEGKRRSKPDGEAAETKRWLLTIVATSERSVADAVKAGGKPLLGGQQDRAVDIPVDGIGVITNFGEFDNFQQVTRHLKKACSEYYGAAGEAILQFACDNPDRITELVGAVQDIEERLMPANCGHGERRIVKFLAAAVVAGNIAIEAGVLMCSPDVVEAAVTRIVMEWWRGRGGSLHRVAEFILTVDDVAEHPPVLRSSAKVFFDRGRYIIPAHIFESEFGDEAPSILNELVGLNALKREQGSRNKSRFCNNRLFAYVIWADRVDPILTELSAGSGSSTAMASSSRNLLEEEMS
jgi:hypothetical protein